MVQFFFHTNLHDVVYTVIQKPLVGLGSGIVPTLIALFFCPSIMVFRTAWSNHRQLGNGPDLEYVNA